MLVLAMVLFPLQFLGQSYTLTELVQKALEENYQLQIARNYEQMAQNRNTYGFAGFLPSVNVTGEQVWGIQNTEQSFFTGEVRSGDNALNTRFNAMAEVDWTVFDGFSMFARKDRLGHLARLGKMETRFFIEQTITDIAHVYNQLIKEKQLLQIYRQSAEFSSFRLNLESRKRQVGAGSTLLYNQALMDFNSDSVLLSDQQMLVKELQIQINRNINEPPSYEVHPMDEHIELLGVESSDVLLERALENNMNLERAHLEEMLADADYRIQRGRQYPQVSVFGNYAFTEQTSELGFVESSLQYGGQFGIRVRFNLYDGGRERIQLRNLQLEQRNMSLDKQDTHAHLESEIARLKNRYNAYLGQKELLQESLEAARQTLSIASEQLEAGSISGFDFRQAQITALMVEVQFVELQYRIKSVEIDLYRISGDLLDKVL